jgi:hypothetical protein
MDTTMTDKIEVSRFDYVLQPDGSWSWAVEVRVTQADTFAATGTRQDTYGPMPPALAESKFGVVLASVISGLNTQTEQDLATTQAALTAAQATIAQQAAQLLTITH